MYVVCKKVLRNGIVIKGGRLDSDTVKGELHTYTLGGSRMFRRDVRMASIQPNRGSPTELARLYNAVIEYAGQEQIVLSGMERLETDGGTCWVAQRWNCLLVEPEKEPPPQGGIFGTPMG